MAFMLDRSRISDALKKEFGDGMISAMWIVDRERSPSGSRVTAKYLGSLLDGDWTVERAADWAVRGYSVVRSVVDSDVDVAVALSDDQIVMITPETGGEPALFDVANRSLTRITSTLARRAPSAGPPERAVSEINSSASPALTQPGQPQHQVAQFGRIQKAPTVPAAQPIEPPDTAAPVTPPQQTPPGWYPDPAGFFEHRWWNGQSWTEHVATQGRHTTHPLK